ncbi:MAG: ISAzo13 family transposase, partial [Bacteroidales bacterium]|nr:ISAzo13 family transposase [Bacteroidales bacterium]
LDVECELDKGIYETGINITDKQMEEISIIKNLFHGEWNYSILPQ